MSDLRPMYKRVHTLPLLPVWESEGNLRSPPKLERGNEMLLHFSSQ
uniref:Uncharacterized protein n=1 Tax=Anguilla anguilla TaxID=7936 RepID=A0A0E9QQP9_ANGAN